MPYVLPLEQALREGYAADTSLLAPMRPFIFGPRAALHRYGNSTEKPTIALGEYDTELDQQYPWPGRLATSKIDLDYAKLYMTDVYLNYFNDYVGAGSTIVPATSTYKNRITSDTVVFKSSTNNAGTASSRNAAFLDRDVTVGDIAFVRGTVSAVTYELWTSVAGFVFATIAASVASATSDTANKSTQPLAVSISQVAGTPINDIDGAASGAAYQSTDDGYITRTYTITVTQSSTGSDATTARLSVVSADGGDNDADVTPAAFGAATAIGAKGLTVTFDELNDALRESNATAAGIAPNDFVVGQQWEVTVSQAWTAPSATSAGTYTGTTDTGYIVTVTRGGQVPAIDTPITAATAGAASAGGALQAGTYYAVYTFVNANGETPPATASASFTTASTNLTIPLTISTLAAGITDGAVSASVYLGTAAIGPFHLYKTGVLTSPTNLVTAYSATTAEPPTLNTATVDAREGAEPLVVVTTTTGVDASGPTAVQAKNQALSAGNYGVTIRFNQNKLVKGDVYHVNATAADSGAAKTLILNNELPTGLLTATDLDLRLFISKPEFEIARVDSSTTYMNWDLDEDYVYTKEGMQVYDSTWTDGGVEVLLPVYQGDMFIEYREWNVDDAGTIININDIANVEDLLGVIDPDNPIAFAAYYALQNVPGTIFLGKDKPQDTATTCDIVRFATLNDAPDAADQEPWRNVLEMISGIEDVYTLVPLTKDANVQQLVVEHVQAQSLPAIGQPRCCLLSPNVQSSLGLVTGETTTDGNTALATVTQDPATTATSYTYLRVTAGNAQFITNNVQEGDIARFQFSIDSSGASTWTEYVIADVVSEDSLLLRTGTATAVAVAQKVEVWRNLSKDEVVAQVTALAQSYDNDRVVLVWPDTVVIGTSTVEGYHLCAIIAAVMGSVPSHQGLTNVEVLGVTAVPRSTSYFSRAQLNALDAGSVFVVTQLSGLSKVFIKHGVTTKLSPITSYEEMCRRNVDMFFYAVQARWAPYIGATNVNDVVLGDISLTFVTTVTSVAQRTKMSRLGSAVASATIQTLTQDATTPDRVYATVLFSGPYPLNKIVLTIVI